MVEAAFSADRMGSWLHRMSNAEDGDMPIWHNAFIGDRSRFLCTWDLRQSLVQRLNRLMTWHRVV
jgi:hypothetical protein